MNKRIDYSKPILWPKLSHMEVAGRVRMLMRNELNHEATCCAARDRIFLLLDEIDHYRDSFEQILAANQENNASVVIAKAALAHDPYGFRAMEEK